MNAIFFLALLMVASTGNSDLSFDEILKLAKQAPQKAIAICEQDTKDVEVETADIETAKKLEFLARFYATAEKNLLADNRVLKAKAIAKRLNSRDLLRRVYQIESVIASHKGEFERGIEASTKSIKLTKRSSPYLAIPLSERGICRMQLGEYALALHDLRKAFEIAAEAKNDKLVLQTRVNMANAYDAMKLYDRAIEIYESSLEIAEDSQRFKKKNKRIIATIHVNIGVSILNKLKSEDLIEFSKITRAQTHFQTAMNIASNSERSLVAMAETGLGDICQLKGDFSEARRRYETARQIYTQLFDALGVAQLNSRMAKAEVSLDKESLNDHIETERQAIAEAKSSGQYLMELDLVNRLIPRVADVGNMKLLRVLLERKCDLAELRLEKISAEALRSANESIDLIEQNYAIEALEKENQFAEQGLAKQQQRNFFLSLLSVGAVVGCGLFGLLWRAKVRVSRKLEVANQRKLEEQQNQVEIEKILAQQKKLDGLSTMSAGVMHDFNNYLLAIIAEAELGAAQNDSRQMAIHFRNVMDSAQLASGLTKDLSNYIGAGKLSFSRCNLHHEILNVRPILQSISHNRIRFENDDSDLIPVEIDTAAFRTVLINLVKNAVEASADDQEIVISTRLQKDSGECHISVTDSGVGMSEESIDKAFDPFFTSKGLGRGLGLPSAKGIVESHGGELKIIPRKSGGTNVQIVLPVTDLPMSATPDDQSFQQLQPVQCSDQLDAVDPISIEKCGTVLFVDDDEMIRRAISSILASSYQTMMASSAEDALSALTVPGNEICCIITDYSLPGLNGVELAEEVADRFSNIPVILVSGYPEKNVSESDCIAAFLPKPFTRQILFSVIEQAIAGKKTPVLTK